jgi:hypothetical protein
MSGSPVDRDYVSWLEEESMLARGAAVSAKVAGSPGRSQRPFARSDPRAAVERASVWSTAYPILLSGGHRDLASTAAGGKQAGTS